MSSMEQKINGGINMEQLKVIIQTIDEKIAGDIRVYNVSDINPFCEYFVICTAQSERQMSAISTELRKMAMDYNFDLKNIEGLASHSSASTPWILVDLGNIVVHIFNKESRIHYGVDNLWNQDNLVDISAYLK